MKPWVQILIGAGFIAWGGGSLIYQMQPNVIGLKSIPAIMLIIGAFQLYIGIKRSRNPEKDAQYETEEEANLAALNLSPANKAIEVSEDVKQGSMYKFLLNSYENWKAGIFDDLSDYYKDTASKDSPETLTAGLLNEPTYKSFLNTCLKQKEPDNDEYMFTLSPDSFMMTNKNLYINTSAKNGQMHVIHLCEIVQYSNKGFWMKSGTLGLKDGRKIEFKLDAVPDETRLSELQKKLNCDHIITVQTD